METTLKRLLEEEIGDCCDTDVENRLAELEGLTAAVPARPGPDRTALRTLGDDTRYRLTRLLAAANRELCVCELTPLVDVSESAISHALADLTDAGLVTRRKDGTWRYYETTERAEALLTAIDTTREGPDE